MPESENVINLKEVKEKRENEALIQDYLSSPRIEPRLDLSGKNLVLSWSVFGYENEAKLHVVMHENPKNGGPCITIGVLHCDEDQWRMLVKEGNAILDAHKKMSAKEDSAT